MASLQYEKQIPEMIIIGIGYEERGQTAWDNRRRVHLPAVNEDLPGSGGADRFLQFMNKELVAFVDSSYRTDPEDQIFVGMSSGGTLGAYVLVTSPETFNRYLIVSPALHSGNEMILDLEKQYFEAHGDLPATVYSAMGEHEPDYMHAPWNTLTDNLEKRNYASLLMTNEIIDGGTHMDAVYYAYVRG